MYNKVKSWDFVIKDQKIAVVMDNIVNTGIEFSPKADSWRDSCRTYFDNDISEFICLATCNRVSMFHIFDCFKNIH